MLKVCGILIKFQLSGVRQKIFEICTYLDNSRKTRTNNSVYLLFQKVNEKTGLGHFNFNQKINTIFFNHKASVKGQDSITIEQVEHFVI